MLSKIKEVIEECNGDPEKGLAKKYTEFDN